jgi:hypothetical protein
MSAVAASPSPNEAAAHGFDYRGTCAPFSRGTLAGLAPAVRKLPVPDGMQPFLAFRPQT